MSEPYPEKDNEFIAWYPCHLQSEQAAAVWRPRRAGYYVHIPFCTAICDYCGFAIEQLKKGDTGRYLAALGQEIRRYAESGRLANYRFVCGHFGGGTPSAIEANELMDIKRLIDASFDVDADAEITVEVNPISFNLSKAQNYFDCGVNRISFGVQSFNDRILKIIGRPHKVRDVEETLDVIHRVGWKNYSLDVIYGVPGESIAELQDDLRRAVASGASHILLPPGNHSVHRAQTAGSGQAVAAAAGQGNLARNGRPGGVSPDRRRLSPLWRVQLRASRIRKRP